MANLRILRAFAKAALVSLHDDKLCFGGCVAKRRQVQGCGLFNASSVVFSYGPTTKSLKILLSSKRQKESAIIRRFVTTDVS